MADGILNPIEQLEAEFDFDVYTKQEVDALLDEKADKSDTYTKTETDALLDDKADADAVYTKIETDTLLSAKADKSTTLAGYGITDAYTKTQTDNLLNGKADTNSVYTKEETDNLLSVKANSADVYTKAETDNLLSAKADSVNVYTKTEADTLLAGKADTDDVYTKAQTDTLLSVKANSADVYTKTESNTLLAGKANVDDVYTKTEIDNQLTVTKDGTWVKVAQNTAINLEKLEGGIEYLYGLLSHKYSQLRKYINGNYYDYETDTDSAYTKTVPAGAMPYAGLEKLGGKTVVMNQLIQNGDFAENTGWTYSSGTTHTVEDGVATIVGAVDNYFTIYLATARAFNIWAGHKYLISAVVSNDIGRVVLVPTGATSGWYEQFDNVSTPTRIFYLYTPASDVSVRMYCRFHNANAGTEQTVTGTISNYMCIDLTLMFGSGNEPTIDEFKAMFPAEYYEATAGTMLSAGVTEVVSKKADTTTIATYPIPAEIQALEGYGWSAEDVYNYVDYERKVFVKNIGEIDLGSLDYNYYSNATAFYAPSPDDSRGRKSGGIACVCARYKTMHYASFAGMATDAVAIEMNPNASSNKRIYIRDDSFETNAEGRAALKESLQGVYLYYELATPQEVDISAYITDDNLIEVEAGGTLTFPNSNGTDYQIPVPSAETYMVDLQSAI